MLKSIKFLFKYGKHRIVGVKSPAEYYLKIGDDVVPTLNGHFTDNNKPLWLNLGYWKKARTYKEACEDMAREVAQKAKLCSEDSILDVGFGYGEQDILWSREYSVKNITGINITPIHVKVATERKNRTEYNDTINYKVGDAVDMKFEKETFDKVVALESAFHFKPRTKFFEESYRVLKEGGLLVIADMVSLKNERKNGIYQKKGRREIYIPDENAIDKEVYCKQLARVGFSEVKSYPIAKYVYAGARKYFYTRAFGGDVYTKIELEGRDFLSEKGPKVWGKAYGLSDYVIFVAKK